MDRKTQNSIPELCMGTLDQRGGVTAAVRAVDGDHFAEAIGETAGAALLRDARCHPLVDGHFPGLAAWEELAFRHQVTEEALNAARQRGGAPPCDEGEVSEFVCGLRLLYGHAEEDKLGGGVPAVHVGARSTLHDLLTTQGHQVVWWY